MGKIRYSVILDQFEADYDLLSNLYSKTIIKSQKAICSYCETELHIRESTEDNSKIIFLISNENIRCDPSLELPRGDSSNDGPQNMKTCCDSLLEPSR